MRLFPGCLVHFYVEKMWPYKVFFYLDFKNEFYCKIKNILKGIIYLQIHAWFYTLFLIHKNKQTNRQKSLKIICKNMQNTNIK